MKPQIGPPREFAEQSGPDRVLQILRSDHRIMPANVRRTLINRIREHRGLPPIAAEFDPGSQQQAMFDKLTFRPL